MKTARALTALLAAGLLATCGDAGPTAGWLQVRLTGPGSDDAGVLFTVSGGPVDSVRTAFASVFMARPDGSSVGVIVAGDRVSGVVAEILVPDVEAVSLYAGVVRQVAAATTLAQRDPAPYRLSIERP